MRVLPALTGATVAAGAWRLRSVLPGSGWERTNHRGATLSLAEGPSLVCGVLAGLVVSGLPPRTRAAAVVAGAGAAGFGLLDDLAEQRAQGARKGLRGHLTALRHGEITTGAVKIVGIGATGAVVACLVPLPLAQRILAAGLVAGTANLINLFDLRPGRALKVTALCAVPLLTSDMAGALLVPLLGAASPMLVVDLREDGMLGDCGANAAGALLGLAGVLALAAPGHEARWLTGVFTLVVTLTLASERVSFSQVIANHPVLHAIDMLGRRR